MIFMTPNKRVNKIRLFIEENIGESEFTNADDLFKQGIVNSMFAMELINFIETEFEFEICNEDLRIDNFRSINAMADLIEKNKS